jgi:hypothetical protein
VVLDLLLLVELVARGVLHADAAVVLMRTS